MRKKKAIKKTREQEIQYQGAMLTATTLKDVGRLKAIMQRLKELV